MFQFHSESSSQGFGRLCVSPKGPTSAEHQNLLGTSSDTHTGRKRERETDRYPHILTYPGTHTLLWECRHPGFSLASISRTEASNWLRLHRIFNRGSLGSHECVCARRTYVCERMNPLLLNLSASLSFLTPQFFQAAMGVRASVCVCVCRVGHTHWFPRRQVSKVRGCSNAH